MANRFRALYGERSTRFYDSAWAIELINDSIDDIESEIAPLNPEFFGTKSGNVTYVADTQEYDLPANFRKVISVLLKDRGGPPYPRLTEIQYWQKDTVYGASAGADWLSGGGKGEPAAYYIQRPDTTLTVAVVPKIGFVPIPNRAGTNAIEVLYHINRDAVTLIGAGETPDIPVDWHPLVPWKMAMNAAALDQNPNFGYYQAGYQGRLARLLGEGLRGQGEGQERIELVDEE